jgi:hypothetical protein
VRTPVFLLIWLVVYAAVFAAAVWLGNDYLFFAGYVVLQYVVLGTAWNILGGYCGYVNFGSAAFFALGAYSTVTIYRLITEHEFYRMPTLRLKLIATTISGALMGMAGAPFPYYIGYPFAQKDECLLHSANKHKTDSIWRRSVPPIMASDLSGQRACLIDLPSCDHRGNFAASALSASRVGGPL